jgi:hypothetical protein
MYVTITVDAFVTVAATPMTTSSRTVQLAVRAALALSASLLGDVFSEAGM